MREWTLGFLLLAITACGGAAATEPAPASTGAEASARARVAGRGTAEEPYLLCHVDVSASEPRTDYSFVASYACPGHTAPLGGAPARGASARVGNVGAGPDGHIVDLYEIPCVFAPVRIYVDSYHCGPRVDAEIHADRLDRASLARLAQMVRQLHDRPSDARANQYRRDMILLTTETQQFTVAVCADVGELLPGESATHPYMVEFVLSMAASVLEDGRDPADPIGVNIAAIRGLLQYYAAILREEGAGARDATMDALAAMAADGSLVAKLSERLARCDASGMGVHFYGDAR